MTCYWDFFGTDNFHAYYGSDASTKLEEESQWFNDYAWNEVSSDNTMFTWPDYVVDVDETDTCETSPSRLGEADEWLKDNFPYYGSSDGCVVLDHYWDGTYYGCAYVGGINGWTEDNKTSLVDYEAISHLPSYDTNGIGIRHYLGMEPGHLYGAKHPDHSQNTSGGYVSFMFNNEGPECQDDGSPEQAWANYTECAEDVIRDYMTNEC